MKKAQRDRQERLWLLDLAKDVATRMRNSGLLPEVVIDAHSELRTEAVDTGGWYVNLGRVRPDRGSGLQIWLDHWPTLASRKVYVCYQGTRIEQIRRVAEATSPSFGRAPRFSDKAWVDDQHLGFAHLRSPLPANLYGLPIAELYQTPASWAFYGIYFRQAGPFSRRPSKTLSTRIRRFLEVTVKSVLGQLQSAPNQEYAAIENRSKVVQHLRRERSPRLANEVKLRDGYTCQICDFVFEMKYGRIGRGFAEAHHRIPLARLRPGIVTRPKDLVTVCPNCHRMLHKMKGVASDVSTLRRAVRVRLSK